VPAWVFVVTKKVREGLTMFSCSELRVGFAMWAGHSYFATFWPDRKPDPGAEALRKRAAGAEARSILGCYGPTESRALIRTSSWWSREVVPSRR
jgi:hypothetical protein